MRLTVGHLVADLVEHLENLVVASVPVNGASTMQRTATRRTLPPPQ
jgi:hypothetical protein